MTPQQKGRQVYDDSGRPIYKDDGTPLLETDKDTNATSAPSRSTVIDLGRGALKSIGNTAIDLGSILHKIPGVSSLSDAVWGLPSGASRASFGELRNDYESTAESIGSFLPDAAMAIGSGGASAGSRILPRIALAAERRAVPLTAREAEVVLSRGMGRATPRSAHALSAEAARTGKPTVTSAAKVMEKASENYVPWRNADTWEILGGSGALGYFSKPAAAAMAAAKLYSKTPAGTIPQALYSASKPIQGTIGAASALSAKYLLALLAGGK